MRKLHAQSKIFEYLFALVTYFTKTREEHHSSVNDDLMEVIVQDMLKLNGEIPARNDLAKKYGVSVKMLNESFKAKHEQSLYSFIVEERFKKAHEALLETDMPMKELADRMGYSHVNHFISAFKKRYGYTPGSLKQ